MIDFITSIHSNSIEVKNIKLTFVSVNRFFAAFPGFPVSTHIITHILPAFYLVAIRISFYLFFMRSFPELCIAPAARLPGRFLAKTLEIIGIPLPPLLLVLDLPGSFAVRP